MIPPLDADTLEIVQYLATRTRSPVKVTHLGNAKGGSQIGRQPKAGQSYTIVYPELK